MEQEIAVDRWEELFAGQGAEALAAVIGRYLAERRWFGGKARRIRRVEIDDAAPVPPPSGSTGLDPRVLLARVIYDEGEPENYLVPIAALAASGESTSRAASQALARVKLGGQTVLLLDALMDPSFCASLLAAIASRRSFAGRSGEIQAWPAAAFPSLRGNAETELAPSFLSLEQSNSSIRFGDRLILKVLRRVEPGMSLDLEISRYLTGSASFPHTPQLAGAIEYRRGGKEPATLAILQEFVPNRGDAWRHALESLERFIRGAVSRRAAAPAAPGGAAIQDPFFVGAELLGRRTAELHHALAGGARDPAFAPEPLEAPRRREIHQGMIGQAERTFRLLRDKLDSLRGAAREAARAVLGEDREIQKRYRSILDGETGLLLIRCHGDYHLGQVLWTGEDFFIIDFEGEPARPLAERRRKRPALQDVAGMIRSFHYASQSALHGHGTDLSIPEAERSLTEGWSRHWYLRSSAAFFRGYILVAASAPYLPATEAETRAILDCFLLDKAVYEVAYELNNRPDWVRIPLQGILELLGAPLSEAS
jgi:trehalose synthase-fused probable maltokinase